MNMDTLLREEVQNELKELGKMQPGTEQYKTTVDGLTKLIDRVNEIDKLNIEHDERFKQNAREYDLKLQQLEDERKDRVVKNALAVAGIAIPSIITIWGTLKSLKFEETGTVTTIMGRGFINKLLPKK